MDLRQRIDSRLANFVPRAPALVIDGRDADYATHCERIRRCMGLLAQAGLQPGDHVAIISRDVAAVAVLMLAGMRSGLAMANLNPDLSAADRALALQACRPRHLFIDADLGPPAGALPVTPIAAQPAAGGLLARLRGNAAAPVGSFWAMLNSAPPAPPPPPPPADAPAMLLFTSGTTSQPKVVVLSHANLSAQFDAFDRVYDYDAGSRILNPLPLHFTDGMLHGPLAAFVYGAALFRPARFDFQQIEALLHGIYRDRITHFIVVPALLSLLDRLGEAFADAFATPHFRYIRSSGDALPDRLWQAIQDRFRVAVVNTYGMSETVCEATYAGPDPASRRIGTIGRPVGCECRVVDGELQVRGGIITAGYLDQPELTAAAIVDGWLRTGDLASIDDDGFVRITGRAKALIISGGINIQPQDISDCLLNHPAVAEAHCIGLPHALWGEQVAAAVRLRPGAAASEAELLAHCRAQLTAHKMPGVLAILPELPRNAAGKVIVTQLRDQLSGADRSAGSAAEQGDAARLFALAAQEFKLPADTLRLTSEPATTPGWNSLAHINLITAAEAAFGVRLSAGDVLRVHRLNDLLIAVQRLRRAA